MIFLKGNGLVIAKKEIEEADRYITVFMEDFGKVSTLIKGIRKSKRRDKMAVDLISLTNFTFYQKGNSIITSDFSGIENYEKIKADYDKLNIVLYLLYFINNILIENNRNRKLYNLLLKSLNSLNKDNELRKDLLLVVYFLYEVLKEEGLIPEVEDISLFFMEQNQKKISLAEQKILIKLYTNDIKEIIDNENYRIEDIKKVIVILETFINSNLSLNLDARKFLWGELLW